VLGSEIKSIESLVSHQAPRIIKFRNRERVQYVALWLLIEKDGSKLTLTNCELTLRSPIFSFIHSAFYMPKNHTIALTVGHIE